VENEIGHKIKVLHSDNGWKFVFKKFHAFLAECGIQRQTSVPYSPQQMVLRNVPIEPSWNVQEVGFLHKGWNLNFGGETDALPSPGVKHTWGFHEVKLRKVELGNTLPASNSRKG
jgi:hypothetical protein